MSGESQHGEIIQHSQLNTHYSPLRFEDNNENNYPDWEEKKLGEGCSVFSGGTPTSSKKQYYGGSIPFIRSAEINKNKTALFFTQEGLDSSSAKIVDTGDLLCALYSTNSGDVGISSLTRAINQAILCIRTSQSTEFLMHF